ncbi:MAG: hypothetical protein PHU85_19050 [Phycisphaerae bacterium]|nr:hypothetical protein [Phycisphaerae bacterium]
MPTPVPAPGNGYPIPDGELGVRRDVLRNSVARAQQALREYPYRPHSGWRYVPVVAPIWNAGVDFRYGHYGWGTFNTVMAGLDVFLVKAIGTAAGRGLSSAVTKLGLRTAAAKTGVTLSADAEAEAIAKEIYDLAAENAPRLARLQGRNGGPGIITRVRRFFYDNRTFPTVSRSYWRIHGPANGASLHHWLFPQSVDWIPQGIRNAGFNLLRLPAIIETPFGGLNQWMGLSRSLWAPVIDWGIRLGIPASLLGAWRGGTAVGGKLFGDAEQSDEVAK